MPQLILRCTQKLLKAIGRTRVELAAPAPDDEDWYANLLWFDRRKCLLLTHAGTLFSVFEANLTVAMLRDTHALLADVVERELAAEGLPADTFGQLRCGTLLLAGTADRQVLGCMRDMADLCEQFIAEHGGLDRADLQAINRALRRNISSARRYAAPIELAAARVRERHGD